jgi:drug efflux transport system permease protein
MRLRILSLMRKEFAELRQSPRLLVLLIVAPIVQLTMLGYAATTDIKNVPMVVADGDRSALSRRLIEQFDASPHFEIAA